MRIAMRHFDHIAFLAIAVALYTHEWLAGAVIVLMYSGGKALEAYASRRATASLAALLAKIPKTALVVREGDTPLEVPLAEVAVGSRIIVRGGELVPLDGELASPTALLNLANLTGEPLPETLREGAAVKSGSVNAGEAFELLVSGVLADSTYAKIVDLVKNAENEPAPFVRFAEAANLPFTLLTLAISGGVYLLSGDLTRVLAVLVVATPCPLIIAAPVAFLGGLSRAASKNIIVKTTTALEATARVRTIFFDKTGTLTLGTPKLTRIDVLDREVTETHVLSLAASLEFHSIHPLARAVTLAAQERHFTPAGALEVQETIGTGITGTVDGAYLSLGQAPLARREAGTISLLLERDGTPLAVFHFADVLKTDAKELLAELTRSGYTLAILTGDSRANAESVFQGLGLTLHADCTPEEKYRLVEAARARSEVVAMIGDGLNDAPALARADVGIVFSGTENSASIEAADVAILGHDLRSVLELFALAKRSVQISKQSVVTGITLSVVAMGVAATGALAPVAGALLQEGIDVTVILNALRAALPSRS